MEMTSMYETKADALEASFEQAGKAEDVAELRAEMAALKARMDAQAVAAARPALSGAKGEASPERKAFVDAYLRKGVEGGIELKSFAGTSDAAGGYAVPREIDAAIDAALVAVSPIRTIANVVKVGSAGYRKLVTTGGAPSGWASAGGARAAAGTPTVRVVAPAGGDLCAYRAAGPATGRTNPRGSSPIRPPTRRTRCAPGARCNMWRAARRARSRRPTRRTG